MHLASLESTLAIAYLGIFPTAITDMTWNYTLSRISTAKAASYLYLVPFLAIAILWIWLRELPSLLAIVGRIITLTDVSLVNLQET